MLGGATKKFFISLGIQLSVYNHKGYTYGL